LEPSRDLCQFHKESQSLTTLFSTALAAWSTQCGAPSKWVSLSDDEENRAAAGAPGVQSARVSTRREDPAVLADFDAPTKAQKAR
jgi:hypothetical protein